MKVKNIVFSGFAAAILMGVATGANADTHVVTKGYIDSLDKTVSATTAGTYVTGVTQADGLLESVATTPFDQAISGASTHDNAPTSKAVYDYVTSNDTTYTAGDYIDIDENNAITVDDITNLGTDIDANDTGLTTGKAVSEYVTSAVDDIEYSGDTYITVNNDNNNIGLTNYTDNSAEITDGNTKLTTANAVFDYVTANDDDTTYTGSGYVSIDGNNDITVTNITSEAAGITDTSTALTTGKAVYEYVTANDDDTTYTGSGYVSIDGDNNITVTNVTNDADGIVTGNTELTTANAVFQYVDELTGGVLPQGCENGNCALVKLNGELQWVELTTPVQDQTTGG